MTDAIRLAGIAIICVFLSLILKEQHKPIGIAVALGGFFIITTVVLGGEIRSALDGVRVYADTGGFSDYGVVLMKALGIAYVTSATKSVCLDAGEGALASAAELAGKGEIMLLSTPLISSLLDIAKDLMKI